MEAYGVVVELERFTVIDDPAAILELTEFSAEE